MSSGRFRLWSPLMTERATLMGFDEPSDLASTSWTPAASRMARPAPPAPAARWPSLSPFPASGRPGAGTGGGAAAVVGGPAAVGDHGLDSGGLGAPPDELAGLLGGVDGGGGALPQLGLGGRGGGEG